MLDVFEKLNTFILLAAAIFPTDSADFANKGPIISFTFCVIAFFAAASALIGSPAVLNISISILAFG